MLLASGARGEGMLREVLVFPDGARILVDRKVRYEAFTLARPPRLVIDLHGTDHLGKPRILNVGSPLLRSVRTDQFISPPSGVTRVVMDLAGPWDYELTQQEGEISVRLFRVPRDLKDSVAPRDLSFWLEEGALTRDQAVLTLSEPVEYRAFFLHNPPRLVIDFPGTRRRSWIRLKAPPGGALKGIRTGLSHPGQPPGTRVVLDLNATASYTADWEGRRLVIDFENPSAPGEIGRREYSGLLLDASGRGLNGVYLVRFYGSGAGFEDFWSESVYVSAQEGFFTAELGRKRPVPLRTEIKAATPVGSGWHILPINPRP